jgi:hypothetical protein
MSNITKSVRFAEAAPQIVCYVEARSDLTTEEMNNTWWSPTAMKEFFLSAKTLSKEAQRSNFMVTGYEQAYETSAVLSQKGKTALPSTLEHVQVHQDLLDWCRFGHSWRGLERSSCVMHNDARTVVTKSARCVVFEMMKRGNLDARVIRRYYERASRSSKIFARIMGEADALASSSSTVPTTVASQEPQRQVLSMMNTTLTASITKGCAPRQSHMRRPSLMLRLAL